MVQLNNFAETQVDPYDMTDSGVETGAILSHWIDDLLYKAKRINNTMSPDEALQSDECLTRIFEYIKTKPKFYTGDDISNLKTYFRNSQSSVCNATKVANFSPNVARKVYERFCTKFSGNILDYSCGWGARLLGCLTSNYNYHYYGIEPNSELNKRLHDFAHWICTSLGKEDNYSLYCQGSEVFIPELVDKIDLSFSSPPYFNLEIYCNEETQSANENTNYSAWKSNYMVPTIENIYKYTKQGGLHIVNLKNLTTAGKEPLLYDWCKACVAAGFQPVTILTMHHQSKRQFNKGKENIKYKGDVEPMAVFIKN